VVSAGCPIGFTFNPTFPTGEADGVGEDLAAPFTYDWTGVAVGAYTLTAVAIDNAGNRTTSTSVNVTVTPGDPATLELTPPTATNVVDAEHCVTAHVEDEFGNVTPGISAEFSVTPTTFHTPSSGSAVTDASGDAEFCYTAALPGSDVIAPSLTPTATRSRTERADDTAARRGSSVEHGGLRHYGGRITR
jgi:hypothetical protein